MTRDLEQIKKGLAQIRAALNLLEKFVADYEARTGDILPVEDVVSYAATDDEVIAGTGLGELSSLNQAIHQAAQELAPAKAV